MSGLTDASPDDPAAGDEPTSTSSASRRGWTPQGLGSRRALPSGGPFLSGGSQNEIYEVRRGELPRRPAHPPTTAPESRDAGIIREWRIIEALDGTDVPHTAAIAVRPDTDVLGRASPDGLVDGWSPMARPGQALPPPFDTDVAASAISPSSSPRASPSATWTGRPRASRTSAAPTASTASGRPADGLLRSASGAAAVCPSAEASAWLQAHKPIDSTVPGLMHGDHQFANVMFAHGAPARLAAIVDWEMGTVGDPSSTWPGCSRAGPTTRRRPRRPRRATST